jgi:hypothetical protein
MNKEILLEDKSETPDRETQKAAFRAENTEAGISSIASRGKKYL